MGRQLEGDSSAEQAVNPLDRLDRLQRRDLLVLRLEAGRRRRSGRAVSVRRGQREMRSTR